MNERPSGIRYGALAAALFVGVVLLAEQLTWASLDHQALGVVQTAVNKVNTQKLTSAERVEVKQQVLAELLVPKVVAIFCLVCVSPFLIGLGVGWKTGRLVDGAVGVLIGGLVVLAIDQALSLRGLVADLLVGGGALAGSAIGRWRSPRRLGTANIRPQQERG